MEIPQIVESLNHNVPMIIVSHQSIDGDGLGSMVSLYLFLVKKKFSPVMIYDETIPYFYQFLPQIENIRPLAQVPLQVIQDNTVFFAVDCSNPQRLGRLNELKEKCHTIINIDHHPDNSFFGTVNYVNPHYPATTLLIYDLIKKTDTKLDPQLAMAILTGLITDTGGFQYVELNSDLLHTVEELVNQGASVATIMRYSFKYRRQTALKLLGIALDHLYYDHHYHFGVTHLLQEDFRSCGAEEEDAEGIVDYGLYIPGSEISVFIKEIDSQNYKISLRSQNETNILPVAHAFGGGGHLKAAGFKIKGDFTTVRQIVIDFIRDYLSSKSTTHDSLHV